tara:strand:+ start:2241 stop:2510 length:270 start_codon:yes stop_codon:yes gene_type:complete
MNNMNNMNKLEILKDALTGRENEILNYQINIDNFSLAIAKIKEEHAGKRGMREFSKNLKERLEDTETEQLKSIILRDVLVDQIAELEAS